MELKKMKTKQKKPDNYEVICDNGANLRFSLKRLG